MSKNIFNDVNNLGPILNNISNQIVSNESVLTLLPNNQVLNLPISTFGKSLIDSTSLADLRSQILENTGEEAIRLLDDGNSEINFYTSGDTASNLRLQITDANTFVKNVLNSEVVKTTAIRSSLGDNSVVMQSNDGNTNIRFVPQNDTISYLQNKGILAFTKVGDGNAIFTVDHTDNNKLVSTNAEFNINVTGGDNTFALYKCQGGEQVSIYSHSGLSEGFLCQKATNDDGIKLNMYHNTGYRPIYLNSANNSKLVIGTENVQTDAEKFIVTSTSRFKDVLICDSDLKTNVIKSNASTLDLYADTHSLKNNAGTNKLTITNSTDTTFINTANTHIQGNIYPSFNGGGNIGVGGNDANTKRYNNLYLYNSLDINGNGVGDSVAILRDDSIADNIIRDNTYCSNMILGTIDSTNINNLGRGFLRLGAGYNSPNIIETYIDLYGANSTDTFQQIKHVINNSNVLTLQNNKAQVHQNMISKTIYPETDITYDLGIASSNEWLNVYTENISVGGIFHHSDMRIKDNIIDLPNDKGLSFIQKLRPVQYTYIKSTQKRKHWGFIAQEIREVVGSDNYSIWGEQKTEFKKQHIAPSEFLGPIVKSIQELYGLLTNTENKPIIIKEQHQGVQEHKCNNYELITQLNSYEVQLLENEEKLNKMDKFLEEVIEDKEKLEINNKLQDLRIIELEKNNLLLNEKIDNLVDKKSDLMTEDDEGESMFDIMNKRMIELENRLIKTENKNKKLTSVINKMIKDK